MSVIVGRALPDARDGLKPVHRRILYAMHGLNLAPTTPHRKCARVVGEVLGKYHPHGDTAVYDALVRLAQPFNARTPLVDGHGNFGSLDADPPAAMRYTECRLRGAAADVLLKDLGAGTVDFAPNFDGSAEEPTVLPARLPLLLINGAAGIAVGIATRIPPHNVGEVAAAVTHLVDNPEASTKDLMRFVPGPDFPTGGVILGGDGVREAYETGRGPITVRGTAFIEGGGAAPAKKTRRKGAAAVATRDSDDDDDAAAPSASSSASTRARIVITELPYQISKAGFVARVAELVDAGTLAGVADVRDESDRSGTRVVVDVRRGASPDVVLASLYKATGLQSRFSVNMVALVNGTPRTLSLRDALAAFIDFRKTVIERRAAHDLAKAKARAHIVAGLLLAMADMDAVVATIRGATDGAAAAAALKRTHGLSSDQADAVLAMALRRLTTLETGKLQAEADELAATIADLTALLADPARVAAVVKREAAEAAAKHGDARRTALALSDDGTVDAAALVPDGESIVFVSRRGFVKRMPADTFAQQARGGRGKVGARLRGDGDGAADVLAVRNHDTLLFFTRDGGVHSVVAYAVPEASRGATGTPLTRLINVPRGDAVAALLAERDFSPDDALLLLTRNALVKRTALDQFKAVRRTGTFAVKMREGTDDELVWVARAPAGSKALIAASDGQALMFAADSLRSSSRSSTGVAAMKLSPGASLVGMVVLPPDGSVRVGAGCDVAAVVPTTSQNGPSVLFVTKRGQAKRVPVDAFRDMRRNGAGVRAIKLDDGDALAALLPAPDAAGTDLLVGTGAGIMLRVAAADVPAASRGARGVRLVKLGEGDAVATVTALTADAEPGGIVGGGGAGGATAVAARTAAAAAAASAPDTPPKPKFKKTAYMVFSEATRAAVVADLGKGAKAQDVMRELAARWRAMDDKDKDKWR